MNRFSEKWTIDVTTREPNGTNLVECPICGLTALKDTTEAGKVVYLHKGRYDHFFGKITEKCEGE